MDLADLGLDLTQVGARQAGDGLAARAVRRIHAQIDQPLLDLPGIGPDAAGDQQLLVVGHVHEGREALAEGGPGEDHRAPVFV